MTDTKTLSPEASRALEEAKRRREIADADAVERPSA